MAANVYAKSLKLVVHFVAADIEVIANIRERHSSGVHLLRDHDFFSGQFMKIVFWLSLVTISHNFGAPIAGGVIRMRVLAHPHPIYSITNCQSAQSML